MTTETIAESPPVETSERNDQYIAELVAWVLGQMRALKDSPVDEGELRDALEELVTLLQELSERMSASLKSVRQLRQDLGDPAKRNALLEEVAQQSDIGCATLAELTGAQALLNDTGEVLEPLYKVTAARVFLGKVKNGECRKSMGQSVTRISVLQEKVSQARRMMKESFGEIERRGLQTSPRPESKSEDKPATAPQPNASEDDDDDSSESSQDESETLRGIGLKMMLGSIRIKKSDLPLEALAQPKKLSLTINAPLARPRRQQDAEEESKAAKRPGSRTEKLTPERKQPKSPAKARKPRLDEKDELALRSHLQKLSKRMPFFPIHHDESIHFTSISDDSFTRISIRSLWAKREEVDGDSAAASALWKRPVSVPRANRAGRTTDDNVTTTYAPTSLRATDAAATILREIVDAAGGTQKQSVTRSAVDTDAFDPGLGAKCAAEFSQEVSSGILEKKIRAHFDSSPFEADRDQVKVLRSSVEIESVPVVSVDVQIKGPRGRTPRFKAWLYGTERRIHVQGLPHRWSTLASLWVAGLLLAGVPIGMLLAKAIGALL